MVPGSLGSWARGALVRVTDFSADVSKLVSVWAKPGKPFLCWTNAARTKSVTAMKPVPTR